MSSWEKVEIGTLYEGLFDGPHGTPPPSDNGAIFLGIKNISDDGHLRLDDVRRIADADFPKWTKRVVPRDGDIVFTYEATLNRYAIIPDGFHGCLGRRLALIRPNVDRVDTKFLFYSFFGKAWRNTITEKTLVGATVDRIPIGKFSSFPIRIPPLPIQKRIARILSAYDDLIAVNERRIAILEEMASRIYEEWFVKLRFPNWQKTEFVEGVPISWTTQAVRDQGNVITGKTPSKKRRDYFGNNVPFLKLPDMHGNIFIVQTNEMLTNVGANSQASKSIPPNSLNVSCIGSVGIVTINSEVCQTNQQINSLVLNDNNAREFMYFTLKGLKDKIERYAATGSTMANLSRSKFSALEFLCPPRPIISRFHGSVAPLFDQILYLQRTNINLRTTRDLLLPRLISGEIDVSDLQKPTDIRMAAE